MKTPPSSPIVIPTDDNSLAFSRTFAEVLNIVYLGGASGAFEFFPNKLNGIK
jgi:hypothetical protein